MSTPIRLGTRGSDLALWQANQVQQRLRHHGFDAEIIIIRTTGDRRHDVSLAQIGGKGLFIKEIEEALERGEVDLAVHSLKDVPSIIPDHFELVGFLERGDARDVWVHPEGRSIGELPPGSVVGTSSPRRRAQLKRLFPHIEVRDIRGNVETRIAKVRSGEYAAGVLAAAGMKRLGREADISGYFETSEMVPAAGQGIVTLECLRTRQDIREAAQRISHPDTALMARTERGVLQQFGERLDCYSAIAAHATVRGGAIDLQLVVSDLEGTRFIETTTSAPAGEADTLIVSTARELVSRGALELLTTGASA